MPDIDPETPERFLTQLIETFDIQAAAKKLGITEGQARRILSDLRDGLVKLRLSRKKEKPAPETLFAELDAGLLTSPGISTVNIYVDGASRGNPGKAGAGAVILDSEGRVIKRLSRYLGIVTNNMAEYSALIMALTEATSIGADEVRVYADSELVVKQINGHYKVKSPDLLPLYSKALSLLKGFKSFKISHIYREKNKEADRLANEAIDKKN